MPFRVAAAAAERGTKGVKNEKRTRRVTFPLFFSTSSCDLDLPFLVFQAAAFRSRSHPPPKGQKRAAAKGTVVPQRTRTRHSLEKGVGETALDPLSKAPLLSPPKNRPREVVSSRAPCSSPRLFLFSFFPSASSPAVHVLSSKEKGGDCSPAEEQKEKLLRSCCPLRSKGNVDTPKRTKKGFDSLVFAIR